MLSEDYWSSPELLERALKWGEEVEAAEGSLREFIRQGWDTIEKKDPFTDGWHIGAICEHLEAVYYGQINNLLINVPPRTSKSTMVSCMFPAWVWLKNPAYRFLFSSYGASIAEKDSRRCRDIIRSDWYQERWGDRYIINPKQDGVKVFSNNMTGFRKCMGIGGSITGEGGDINVCVSYDTNISTDQGDIKIGDIVDQKIDCKILSYNHESGEQEYKEIEAYERNPGKKILQIEVGDEVIECTEDHPIFIEGKGYVPAGELMEGDIVICL